MNPAAALSITACAIEALLALLCLGVARAPGWRHVRWLAFLAGTAALYSAADVPLTLDVPTPVILLAGEVSVFAMALHAAGWLVYTAPRADGAAQPGRIDRALLAALLAVAGLAVLPGVLADGGVYRHEVPSLGLRYRTASPTALGDAAFLVILAAMLVPALRWVRRVRARVPGAVPHALGFGALLAAGVNEGLVAAHVVQGPYLLGLGLLLCTLAIGAVLVREAVEGARALRDLSARLERTVAERTAELGGAQQALARSERLAALGLLAAGVAHEVNNPLAYVVANTGFVREELLRLAPGEASAAAVEALGEIREGAERIRRIVGDLGVFGRGGVADAARGPVDVRRVLDSALQLTRHLLPPEAVVERDYQEVPDAAAGGAPLAQVFANLLANAAQALPPGRADHRIRLRTRREGAEVVVEIEDTGCGIPPELLPRVFEPFVTTRRDKGATGMGLSICHGLVVNAGGRIELEPRAGGGTRARVRLPSAG